LWLCKVEEGLCQFQESADFCLVLPISKHRVQPLRESCCWASTTRSNHHYSRMMTGLQRQRRWVLYGRAKRCFCSVFSASRGVRSPNSGIVTLSPDRRFTSLKGKRLKRIANHRDAASRVIKQSHLVYCSPSHFWAGICVPPLPTATLHLLPPCRFLWRIYVH
jgi:hypothetical protein